MQNATIFPNNYFDTQLYINKADKVNISSQISYRVHYKKIQ